MPTRPELEKRSSWTVALLACSLVLACEEQTSTPAEDLTAPCKAVGQRCEFSPGKLGSCVARDGCQGPNCFVCQSQH